MEKEVYLQTFLQEDCHWWFKGMRKITLSLLDIYYKDQKDLLILDAGCGTGGMMNSLEKYGNVFGVDFSPEAIVFCKKRNLSNISQASIEKLPFSSQYFDIVVCLDVIYHQGVKDDRRAVQELYRVLKPGGRLFLRVPANPWFSSYHAELVHTRHRYSKNEIRKLLSQFFFIEKLSYINTFLFLPSVLKRQIEKMFSKKRSLKRSLDLETPLWPLAKIFYSCLLIESFLIKKINFPFGLSLIAIAKKSW